CQQGNSF
nr:immunoglobulin light chain junction region [Macaca mulatta]MOV86226.1 immunoglobulin light chain junction region [Macaca mulatta]